MATDLKSELISYVNDNDYEYKENDSYIVINKVIDITGNVEATFEYSKENNTLGIAIKKEVAAKEAAEEESTEEVVEEEAAVVEYRTLSPKEIEILKRLLKVI